MRLGYSTPGRLFHNTLSVMAVVIACAPFGTQAFARDVKVDRIMLAADLPSMLTTKVDGEPAMNKEGRELLMPVAASTNHASANFLSACASCHYGSKGKLLLDDRSALGDDDPEEFIEVTLFGIEPEFGESGLEMPGFARSFTDAQVAQLAAHMRETLTTKSPWPDLEAAIAKQRAKGAED